MKDARGSERVDFIRPVRYVERTQRKDPLLSALGVNLSLEGVSIQSAVLPLERHERLEMYLPIEDHRLIAVEAEQVWFDLETEGNHPHWIRAGYRIRFHNVRDEESYVRSYFDLGGRVTKIRTKNRVEYVF